MPCLIIAANYKMIIIIIIIIISIILQAVLCRIIDCRLHNRSQLVRLDCLNLVCLLSETSREIQIRVNTNT